MLDERSVVCILRYIVYFVVLVRKDWLGDSLRLGVDSLLMSNDPGLKERGVHSAAVWEAELER